MKSAILSPTDQVTGPPTNSRMRLKLYNVEVGKNFGQERSLCVAQHLDCFGAEIPLVLKEIIWQRNTLSLHFFFCPQPSVTFSLEGSEDTSPSPWMSVPVIKLLHRAFGSSSLLELV